MRDGGKGAMNERRCPFCFEPIPKDFSGLKPILNPHPYCSMGYKLRCGHYIQTECKAAEFENLCYRSREQLEKNDNSRPPVLIKRAENPRFDKLWCRHNEWQYINVCVHHQQNRKEGCIKCWIGKFFLEDEDQKPKTTLIRRRKR